MVGENKLKSGRRENGKANIQQPNLGLAPHSTPNIQAVIRTESANAGLDWRWAASPIETGQSALLHPNQSSCQAVYLHLASKAEAFDRVWKFRVPHGAC